MGGSARRTRCAAAAALLVLLTTACTVTSNGAHDAGRTPHPAAPTDANGVEVWDLRTPPSASDVGMHTDRDHVAYETDEPRRVRFLLPEGKELDTTIYLLIFQRITHQDPTDPTRPTGIDLDTKAMPLDRADAVMRDALTSFGLGTSAVDAWRREIAERPRSGTSADLGIKGGGNTRIGYLSIGVGGEFDPFDADGSAHVTYHVNLY